MRVLIIDYGMSNLGSVVRSVEKISCEVFISKNPEDIDQATHIVLPGVGSFKEGMKCLETRGWVGPLKKAVLENGLPLLGICLGMQLLASQGYEGGEVLGLGVVPGQVKRLAPESHKTRVPHVGWNDVYSVQDNPLWCEIPNPSDFYFVHSYHFVPDCKDHILATTPYCGHFASVIKRQNILGVQFHPEKSSRPGRQLLKNFFKN